MQVVNTSVEIIPALVRIKRVVKLAIVLEDFCFRFIILRLERCRGGGGSCRIYLCAKCSSY
eukprot:SAG31_NODE_1099_length_9914_cov_6.721345_3_plen_61_part_00